MPLLKLIVFCSGLFGQRVTTELAKINESSYVISWYLMPVNVQKKIPAIMAIAQRPLYFRGYMNIQCTHEFFEKVNRSLSSWKLIMMEYSFYFIFSSLNPPLVTSSPCVHLKHNRKGWEAKVFQGKVFEFTNRNLDTQVRTG